MLMLENARSSQEGWRYQLLLVMGPIDRAAFFGDNVYVTTTWLPKPVAVLEANALLSIPMDSCHPVRMSHNLKLPSLWSNLIAWHPMCTGVLRSASDVNWLILDCLVVRLKAL